MIGLSGLGFELNLNRDVIRGPLGASPALSAEDLVEYVSKACRARHVDVAACIYARGHQITHIPSAILSFGLCELMLSHNLITLIPKALCSVRTLSKLWLSSNQLRHAPPREMAQLTNLHLLYLDENPGLPERLQKATFGSEDTQGFLAQIVDYHNDCDAAVAFILCWRHRHESDNSLLKMLSRDLVHLIARAYIMGQEYEREVDACPFEFGDGTGAIMDEFAGLLHPTFGNQSFGDDLVAMDQSFQFG